MAAAFVLVLGLVAGITAFPSDKVFAKWNKGLRYSYLEDGSGKAHLVDNWLKVDDLAKMARYDPDVSNVYHLFTRNNPTVSQPMILSNMNLVQTSNFNRNLDTWVLMHGWAGSATSDFNAVIVPSLLAAGDYNVIVLDWSAGSALGPLAIPAGQAGGRFINWLNSVTGCTASQYSIVGFSVGGHGAGIIARNVIGDVPYVIGLDPAERWPTASMFSPNDGIYTEVIHTSTMGEIQPMGNGDFYPNGGSSQPGCLTGLCEHLRSYVFFGESLVRGGFTSIECATLEEATSGRCNLPGRQRMGGVAPKTGSSGLYYLSTNSRSPFSQG